MAYCVRGGDTVNIETALRELGPASRRTLAEHLGVRHDAYAFRSAVTRLVDAGVIEAVGTGRGARLRLSPITHTGVLVSSDTGARMAVTAFASGRIVYGDERLTLPDAFYPSVQWNGPRA